MSCGRSVILSARHISSHHLTEKMEKMSTDTKTSIFKVLVPVPNAAQCRSSNQTLYNACHTWAHYIDALNQSTPRGAPRSAPSEGTGLWTSLTRFQPGDSRRGLP